MVAPAPGRFPRKNAMKEQREMGQQGVLPVLEVREEAPEAELRLDEDLLHRLFEVAEHLGDREEAHRHADEARAVQEGEEAEGEPLLAAHGVHAHAGHDEPEDAAHETLHHGLAGQAGHQGEPHEGQGEVLRRPEGEGHIGQGGRDEGEQDHRQRPGDEGRQGGHAQRGRGPPLLGHLRTRPGRSRPRRTRRAR